ncbi:PHP domain-containing protein [Candidatus Peregrinibacteria bacterium]|nr:PHP domain-containing protein [Candidatus Peregrinibacteria bacterium]
MLGAVHIKLKAALHCHTGEDPQDPIPYTAREFLDQAALFKFEVVSFTCHDFFFWNEKIKKYAEEKNILLIPGIEKKIEGKHVVILNANKETENIKTFEQLAALKKKFEYFVLAPHPFFPGRISLGKKLIQYINLFDAIEFSYFYSKKINANKKAEKIAKKYNKPLIGTSDIHVLKYMNPTYTIIQSKKDTHSVLSALRKNAFEIKSKPFKAYQLIQIFATMIGINPLQKLAKKWKKRNMPN